MIENKGRMGLQYFRDIIGQKFVLSILQNAVKYNRIGHAYVFSGPKGIGKKTAAHAYANLLLCHQPGESGYKDACGHCRSCVLAAEGTHPDLKVIEASGNSIGVDSIRFLQEDVYIKPMVGQRKVFMIIDGDLMTEEAQNALLKTFETPPAYTTIIITAVNWLKLLDTIRSRAFRLDFKKNSKEDMEAFFSMSGEKKTGDMEFIISYADGVIGKAQELIKSEEFRELREKTIQVACDLLETGSRSIFHHFKFFLENKEHIDNILDILELWYRDVMIAGKLGEDTILINSDKKDIIIESASKITFERLMHAISVVEDTRANLLRNANYELAIEVMLLKVQEDHHSW